MVVNLQDPSLRGLWSIRTDGKATNADFHRKGNCPRMTPRQRAQRRRIAARLRAKGFSLADIGQRWHIDPATVSKMLKEAQ